MENSALQEHTLLEILKLQKKIHLLEQLQLVTNWRNIRIMFEAKKGLKEDFFIFDQFIFPFSLETEFKILIEDSLEQLNRDIETLNFKLKII